MTDLERLRAWMKAHELDYRAVAEATGDTKSTVNMILNGNRAINQAFKWRFGVAYGFDEACRVFVDSPVEQVEPVP